MNVIQHFEFVTPAPYSTRSSDGKAQPKTINWYIPPIGKGSGGHLNIFRFAKNLESLGYINRFIVVAESLTAEHNRLRQEEIKDKIAEWFMPLNAECFRGTHNLPPAEFAIATGWQTAYYVAALRDTCHKCYFIQDYEPWFYSRGSEYFLAENTYKLGFVGITAGHWLQNVMRNEYGMEAHAVGFSYDKDLYHPPEQLAHSAEKQRVFFYARPPTPRRAFDLGVLVLNEVRKRLPNVEIVMAGWDLSQYEFPFEIEDHGIMALNELPGLYATCSAALVLSFSNLSLLPLELMASGVPVVSNNGDWVQWLLNGDNACLSEPTIDGLADALVKLLSDEALRRAHVQRGLEFARSTSWIQEARRVDEILSNLALRAPTR
ncbi:glycosyltransferase family 4 protein [Burkholderia vietnamiensis]|jgi:glycosyltransferase involved in cell wall biosynthesis|uniref:Glycosyl transferase group 1 n=1 Tax=Burkholderia vietnamiensis TaxID=60552 RepID=A0AA44XTW1_BURVI|nr:glycosyltransferase family 4 protein [Burkholderia vietnamiensis]PRH38198.1 glycosyl transferase group 1 [Burkholderia vietnamiensis]